MRPQLAIDPSLPSRFRHPVKSAPSAMFSFSNSSRALANNVCDGKECLPADSVAWVEHLPLPRPLGELSLGQKVLCYDRVGDCMRHVEVRYIF